MKSISIFFSPFVFVQIFLVEGNETIYLVPTSFVICEISLIEITEQHKDMLLNEYIIIIEK